MIQKLDIFITYRNNEKRIMKPVLFRLAAMKRPRPEPPKNGTSTIECCSSGWACHGAATT